VHLCLVILLNSLLILVKDFFIFVDIIILTQYLLNILAIHLLKVFYRHLYIIGLQLLVVLLDLSLNSLVNLGNFFFNILSITLHIYSFYFVVKIYLYFFNGFNIQLQLVTFIIRLFNSSSILLNHHLFMDFLKPTQQPILQNGQFL